MADLPTSIEMNVPADQVDATVASVCAEWGVDQADVEVDVQSNGGPGPVRVIITLHTRPGTASLPRTRPVAGLSSE